MDNAGLSIDAMLKREWNATGDNGATFTIVDSATRGNEWYAIVECKRPDKPPVYDGLVCLVKRSKRTGEFCYNPCLRTTCACGPTGMCLSGPCPTRPDGKPHRPITNHRETRT